METGKAEIGSNRIRNDEAAGCAQTAQDEQRSKRFDECGIEEKVLRLRDALFTLSVMGERATNVSEEASRIAKVHDHGSGGQVVMPLSGANEALMTFDSAEKPFRRIQRLLG